MTFDPSQLAGPAWVTLACVLVYYGFMVGVARTKTRLMGVYKERGEKFDRYFGEDREMLAADRTQLNMLEHMPVFLVLLWMHAVFGSPTEATWAGAVYVASRAAYPFVLGNRLGRGIPTRILLVTVTGYLVILFFVVRIVMALLAG